MVSFIEKYARFQPRDRAHWRRWLEKHHASSPGILLVYVKKPARSLAYADAVEEALCVGWIDSTGYPIDDRTYMQLFAPRKPKSGWSALNKRRAETLIGAGLMKPAGLAKIEAAKENGAWSALDHVESLTLPPAFDRALQKNRRARAQYDRLPPFTRKMFLYYINGAKREATRAQRIADAVRRLAAGARHPRED